MTEYRAIEVGGDRQVIKFTSMFCDDDAAPRLIINALACIVGLVVALRFDPFQALLTGNPSFGVFSVLKPFDKIDSSFRTMCDDFPGAAGNKARSEGNSGL